MQFNFSESELSYIIKHFNYPSLIGVEKQLYDEQRVISSLCDKKYLMFVNGDYELSYAVRILLNAWRSIRYSIVRTDLNDDKYLTCIFASEEDAKNVFVPVLSDDERKCIKTFVDNIVSGRTTLYAATKSYIDDKTLNFEEPEKRPSHIVLV